MLRIFLREVGMFGWYAPINAKAIIKDGDAAICLWMIELITLVFEHSCLRKDGETMSKALWDKEL